MIAQAGSPRELYEQPADTFVAGFMREAMLFDAQAQGDGTVALGPLRVRARQAVSAGTVTIAIRPEAWPVVDQAQGEPVLEGEELKFAYLGSVLELTVRTALGEIFLVSPRVDGAWRVGDPVALARRDEGVSVVGSAAGAT